MNRTIVLALDGSEGADRAIPIAIQLASRDGANIIVAHARTRALETAIDAHLEAQIQKLRTAGVESEVVKAASIDGREADVIAKVAHDRDADMIVIAGRGRSPFVGATLGSVTYRLMHLAACPVLVVPPGDTAMQPIEPDAVAATGR